MSKNDSEKYNNLYKNKYKTIIHNSIEGNKHLLYNVNIEWSKADLLIYSPTIESGVDFSIKNYFDKCYILMAEHSTSGRALLQMGSRIRYYKDNNILTLIPKSMSKYLTN